MKLQKTLKASREQPWLGSIQYSPGEEGKKDRRTDGAGPAPHFFAPPLPSRALTVLQVGVAELQLLADARGALGGAQGSPQLLDLGAQGAERGVHLLQPLVVLGGALLAPSPLGCPSVPPAPARGQRLEQLSRAALGGARKKGGEWDESRAPPLSLCPKRPLPVVLGGLGGRCHLGDPERPAKGFGHAVLTPRCHPTLWGGGVAWGHTMGAPTLSPYPCPSPALTGEPLEPFWPKGPCGEEKRGERRGLGATLGVQLPPTPPRGSCPPLPLSHPGDKAPQVL